MSKILDTRDLQKRLDELEEYEEALKSALQDVEDINAEDPPEDDDEEDDRDARLEKAEDAVSSARSDFGDDEEEELKELREMAEEIFEWRHGETLIRDDYWEDYCRQFADDIGAIPDGAENRWPCNCIDWEQAAKELAHDYSTITYQGDEYYYRNS